MSEIQILFFKLLSIVLIVFVGYFLASKKVLGNDATKVISLLLNSIALPFMIFSAYTKIVLDVNLLINIVIIVVAALIIYVCNYIYASYRIKKGSVSLYQKAIYLNGMLHSNTAFLAFPLISAVYGEKGLFYATIYFMVDNFLLTTIGISRMKEKTNRFNLAPVTYALIISLITMLLLNLFNFNITNTFIYYSSYDIGLMTTPLAFLFIGFLLFESNLKEVILNRVALELVVVKMSIIPLILIFILYLINLNFETILVIVIFTQALMPPFSALLPMAYQYNQDTKLATSIVVIGHIFAMISIPIIFSIIVYLFR